MNFCPPSTIPPNAESKKLAETLRLLMYVQLLVAILKLFTPKISSSGFSDLICCLLIYQGYRSLMHYYLVMAIFFEGFSFIRLFAIIGGIIQNGNGFYGSMNPYFPTAFGAIIGFLSVPLYLAVIINCFYAYREFKALAYEGLSGGFGLQLYGGNNRSLLPTTSQQQQTPYYNRKSIFFHF